MQNYENLVIPMGKKQAWNVGCKQPEANIFLKPYKMLVDGKDNCKGNKQMTNESSCICYEDCLVMFHMFVIKSHKVYWVKQSCSALRLTGHLCGALRTMEQWLLVLRSSGENARCCKVLKKPLQPPDLRLLAMETPVLLHEPLNSCISAHPLLSPQ